MAKNLMTGLRMKNDRKTPYEQGALEADFRGRTLKDNPFKRNSADWRAWGTGFTERRYGKIEG